MRTLRLSTIMPLAAVVLLLCACGSSGLPDVFGGGGADRVGEVRGTVERVDSRAGVLYVESEDDAYRSRLRNAGGEVALYFDDETQVTYQERRYRPQDLESGDRIAADVERQDDRLWARSIEVLYDVSAGGSSEDRYAAVRGFVRDVDTRARTLELERVSYRGDLDRRSGDRVLVHYDSSTVVEFRGQRYQPENLERGDEVEVEVRDLGNRLLAEQIEVLADVRGR